MLKFLRIVAEIRNDAISLSHECHKSIVKSTGALSHSYSLFCILFSLFPFSHFHCQRVKSIRAGCAPVQFDSCQSATPAAFAGSPVALCPSLAPTGSTSSYDSVWGFALPAQAGSVCVACTGYECNTLWSTAKTPQHRDREAHRGTQEPSCEQDMDRTETETETTTMQMQMQSSQN